MLANWDRLNWCRKLDLLWRSASAFWDALVGVGATGGIRVHHVQWQASPRQKGLKLLAGLSLIRRRQSPDLFNDQPVVECEEFKSHQAWRVQSCRFKIGQMNIARPGMMSGGGDHRQYGSAMLIESSLAQHQGWAPFVTRLRAEGEWDDNDIPLIHSLRRLWGARSGRFF